jgi:hypothetical protein
VKAEGFEPSTACLEGRCSLQLSYASIALEYFLSGWQDSNLRPPAPKAGAITELRYTPKIQTDIVFKKYLKKVLNFAKILN